METLPDLLSLSDAELSSLLSSIEDAEEAISRRRRVLHGRIDILRAERIERLKVQVADGSFETTPPTSLERPIYEGTLENGKRQRFVGRHLWVYVFAPANLRLKLNGHVRPVPGAGTGSRRWLEVTPARVKLAPPA